MCLRTTPHRAKKDTYRVILPRNLAGRLDELKAGLRQFSGITTLEVREDGPDPEVHVATEKPREEFEEQVHKLETQLFGSALDAALMA